MFAVGLVESAVRAKLWNVKVTASIILQSLTKLEEQLPPLGAEGDMHTGLGLGLGLS